MAARQVMIGRVGIGIIMRNGATSPNISTAEALKQAVLAADALVYNTAGSGQAVQKMFEDMGISAQIQSKVTRPSNAAQTMDRIIQGKGNEIGFGFISEIKPYETKGVRMVGPVTNGAADLHQLRSNYFGRLETLRGGEAFHSIPSAPAVTRA